MLYIKPAPCIISNWEQRTGFGAEIVINDHCELPSPRQTLKNVPPPKKKNSSLFPNLTMGGRGRDIIIYFDFEQLGSSVFYTNTKYKHYARNAKCEAR